MCHVENSLLYFHRISVSIVWLLCQCNVEIKIKIKKKKKIAELLGSCGEGDKTIWKSKFLEGEKVDREAWIGIKKWKSLGCLAAALLSIPSESHNGYQNG